MTSHRKPNASAEHFGSIEVLEESEVRRRAAAGDSRTFVTRMPDPDKAKLPHPELLFAWMQIEREHVATEEAGTATCADGAHDWGVWAPVVDPALRVGLHSFVRECQAEDCTFYQVRRVPPRTPATAADKLRVGLLPAPPPRGGMPSWWSQKGGLVEGEEPPPGWPFPATRY
jgi:hypothetical protein